MLVAQPPAAPHDVWAVDFVHDQLATGRKIRMLTVVDTFSSYASILDAQLAYRSEDVERTLDKTCKRTGHP